MYMPRIGKGRLDYLSITFGGKLQLVLLEVAAAAAATAAYNRSIGEQGTRSEEDQASIKTQPRVLQLSKIP